ncbi:MAG: YidB family protein [Pseudomonadota bacterium]
MSNRMPSLLALLGLAAAAGYQNRDQLRSMLDKATSGRSDSGPDPRPDPRIAQSTESGSDLSGNLLGSFQSGGLLGSLQSGLTELVQRFTQGGAPDIAESWVGTGQNKAVTPDQLRPVLGNDVIAELAAKTGLSEVDLLARLSQVLPETVDELTPQGRIGQVADLPPNAPPLGQY